MKRYGFSLFGVLCAWCVWSVPSILAQTVTQPAPSSQSMEVNRVGLADLNGILRAADAILQDFSMPM